MNLDMDLDKAYPRKNVGLRIFQENPQPIPEFVAEMELSSRPVPTLAVTAKFKEHTSIRKIPSGVAHVLIQPGKIPVACTFVLPETVFATLGSYEEVPSGKRLDVVNLTARNHTLRPQAGTTLNGVTGELHLLGLGSSAELYLDHGRWILIGSHQAEFKETNPTNRK